MTSLAIKAALIVAALAATGTGYGVWHHKVYQSGWDAAIASIASENREAVDAVNKLKAIERGCDPDRWDQSRGVCQ